MTVGVRHLYRKAMVETYCPGRHRESFLRTFFQFVGDLECCCGGTCSDTDRHVKNCHGPPSHPQKSGSPSMSDSIDILGRYSRARFAVCVSTYGSGAFDLNTGSWHNVYAACRNASNLAPERIALARPGIDQGRKHRTWSEPGRAETTCFPNWTISVCTLSA